MCLLCRYRHSRYCKAAAHRHRFSWPKRLSSSFFFRMHSRITLSSEATVDTQNSRTPKCCPTKLRFRSPWHPRQMIDDTCARNVVMNRKIKWDFGRAMVLNGKSLSEASFFESTKGKGRQKFSFYIIVDTCRYAQYGLVGFAKT